MDQKQHKVNRTRLIKVLERLVCHDEAADRRAGLPNNCVEIEAARDLLGDLKMYGYQEYAMSIEEEMWCGVERIEYDFETKVGRLYMPRHDCCDMNGCIAFFTRIDPRVEVILTFSGEVPDTLYDRDRNGRFGAWMRPRADSPFLKTYLRRFQGSLDRSKDIDARRSAQMKEGLADFQRELIAMLPIDPATRPS